MLAMINWEEITSIVAILAAGAVGASQMRTHRAVKNVARQEGTCPVHESVMELLRERKENADEERREIKKQITGLSDRTDKGFEVLFKKMDALHSLVRNGSER